jgi:hypothetical protein
MARAPSGSIHVAGPRREPGVPEAWSRRATGLKQAVRSGREISTQRKWPGAELFDSLVKAGILVDGPGRPDHTAACT